MNQHIFNVKFDNKKLNKFYLKACLNLKLTEMIQKSHGGVGLQHITKSELNRIKLPVPKIEAQNKFTEIVKKIETMTEFQNQSEHESTLLFGSLMQKAFNGELIS